MTTVGARYEARAGPADAAPPDRAARGRRRAWRCAEDDLCTTIGATEGLSLALRAVAKPGDVIAVESPAYFGVLQTIEGLGLRALEIPAHPRTGLDVDAFEETLRTAARRARSSSRRRSRTRSARSCPTRIASGSCGSRSAHDIPVIEDDVYGELVFDGSRPRPLRAFDDEDSHVLLVQLGLEDARARLSRRLDRRRPLARSDRPHEVQPVARVPDAARHGGRGVPRVAAATIATCAGCARRSPATSSAIARRSRRVPRRHARLVAARRLRAVGRASAGRRCARAPRAARCAAASSIAPGPLFSARQRFGNFVRISAGTPWDERIAASIRTLGRLAAKE